jgi:hypothetical protein
MRGRSVLWTRDGGSIETLAIRSQALEVALGAREAKAFHKGIKRHANKGKGLAGTTRDRSHRALKQSGGFVTSGWQNRRPNMRLSKAIMNAATRAMRDE